MVGLGPGGAEHRTARAARAVAASVAVYGYMRYVEDAADLLDGQEVVATGMRAEEERVRRALERAAAEAGKTDGGSVALIGSGDAGVYGLAGLAFALRAAMGLSESVDIEVVPGVTAALAAAAELGSPLTADYATISLSDLLTPWAVIEKRLRAAADADFVVALYNPRSRTRTAPWENALAIFRAARPDDTPCGLVRAAGTDGSAVRVLTLAALAAAGEAVDMRTLVMVGNSQTRVIDGRLVTRRGYGAERECP